MSEADRERAEVRVRAARCPYCHDEVPRGEEPAACPTCHALHHEGCLREHGACAACDAVHPRFPRDAVEARDPVVETRVARAVDARRRYLVALAVMALTLLRGVVGAAAPGNDQVFGALATLAAIAAVALNARDTVLGGRRASLVLSSFVALFGALVLAAPLIDEHVGGAHRAECVQAGTFLLVTGLALQAIALWRRSREPVGEETS